MSSGHAPYESLPLSNDDLPSHSLYNAPPSPEPHASFYTTNSHATELGPDPLPSGAAQPRFLGAAAYQTVPLSRDSFTSPSTHTLQSPNNNGSEYTSSIYALNDSTSPSRPNPNLVAAYHDDPNDSYFAGASEPTTLSTSPVGGQPHILEEKRAAYAPTNAKSRRRNLLLAALAVALVLLAAAVVIPIYFAIIKPKHGSSHQESSTDSPASTAATPLPTKNAIVTGGDGSTVTMEDGTTFTYVNKFGGHWYYDENDPFNNGAQAQSWTPALNQTFNYGIDKIRGQVMTYHLIHCTQLAPQR
jgi:glucan 1,3-beta-glucosidase